MQCSRCMQYGHGGANCHLPPLCIRCAEKHQSGECPLLKDEVTKQTRTHIPVELIKCGLCGQNHPANFSGCSKRIEFMNRQNVYRARTQNRRPPQQSRPAGFAHAPQLDGAHFPSIPNANPNGAAWSVQPRIPIQQGQQAPTANQDLFSSGECLNFVKDLMSRMRTCTTREQQILAMSEIVMNHLYGV